MSGLFKSGAFGGGVKITDSEFIELRDIIYELSGIHVADKRKFLIENRFSPRLEELKLKSFTEYISYLKHDINRKKELNHLVECITTNETSFFRDNPQLKAFQNAAIKEIIDKANDSGRKEIKIWSAGCSSGEEPYTLSIILHEALGNDISKWRIRITASDISSNVLSMAKKGMYTDYALRTTPKHIVAKYFDPVEDGVYSVKPEVRRLVYFDRINLNDRTSLKKIPKSHIVFCRNVIIYFDKEMKQKVIGAFYDNLLPEGFLFVGHSESLHTITNTFKAIHHTGAISYRKV